MAGLFAYSVHLFGQLPPSLSHLFQDHTVPLRLRLFGETVAFLRKCSILC